MLKFWKIFKLFFLALVFFVFQISFINGLDNFFASFNIVLFFLIYVFIIYDFRFCLLIGFFVGFLFDIFSFYPFGIYSLVILVTIFIVNFLLLNLFTNRSIYSFAAIGFFFSFFYYLFLYLILYLFADKIEGIAWFNGFLFLNFLKELIFILLAIIFSFYFLGLENEKNKKFILLK
ncbi:rod shape-determining protein MreD [Candidatus Falkowbacteria bacterium HGW-Falkowbacteria-1]|jgi:rod shape-determining protein MreD|uniref:Rod shape-determining protein MreD n=1 Tax=Candidatus Falkowbacteria bacterium HGW-Falkowbacteria-1 TaxID=2013768 RepID=A0A2N2E9Y8_9BACT|nr:MAG: rod shape-determining protein MreD [Candidatus Falkowbacteria bacterium HGW-Falkowbacteria-1]